MSETGDPPAPMTVVIGDLARWADDARVLPDIAGLHFLDPDDIDQATLDTLMPEIILSPLLVRNIDALDIARNLRDIGFDGRYRVLSINMPDPDKVEAEIKASVPDVDIALLNITRPVNED